MERRHSTVLDKITGFFYTSLEPELVEWQEKALRGEVSELLVGGRVPLIYDCYGNAMRIRIPWAEDGLEKSYIAKVDETGSIALKLEGFFKSDKRDWPK